MKQQISRHWPTSNKEQWPLREEHKWAEPYTCPPSLPWVSRLRHGKGNRGRAWGLPWVHNTFLSMLGAHRKEPWRKDSGLEQETGWGTHIQLSADQHTCVKYPRAGKEPPGSIRSSSAWCSDMAGNTVWPCHQTWKTSGLMTQRADYTDLASGVGSY